MLSIIIPVWNQHEMTAECIEALRECTDNYEVLLIDNGSNPPYENVVVRNDKNIGFPAAVNQGVKKSRGDIIVLLNNDVIVTPGWSERLEKHLEQFSVIGPVTNYAIGLQGVETPIYDDKYSLYYMAQDWGAKHEGQIQEVNWVIGFCMMIKRSLFDEIGYFDDSMWPCTGEEVDFCLRAREIGHRICVVKDCFVHHYGSITFRDMQDKEMIDYAEIVHRNNEHLKKKWTNWDLKQTITPKIEHRGEQFKINLGCGYRKIPGYVNIDVREEVSPDFQGDVIDGLPFEDNSVDEVRAYDFLEHIPIGKTIEVINEIWRVLRPGGLFESFTPNCERGQGAWMDPTHASFWCENSWLYYSENEYRNVYGIDANFEIKSMERIQSNPKLRIEHLLVKAVARK